MFETLVESGARRPAQSRAGAMALAVHVVVVAFAVQRSHQPPVAPPRPEPINIIFDAPAPPASPTPMTSAPSDGGGVPPSAPTPDFVPGPVAIDPLQFDSIRPLDSGTDLRSTILVDAQRSRFFTPGSTGSGTITDGVRLAAEVDEPARVIRIALPRYPRAREAAGIPGHVVLQFVVDTSGVVEANSYRIVSATDSAFAEASREAVSETRFSPARAGGRKVRQLVQQGVDFKLN